MVSILGVVTVVVGVADDDEEEYRDVEGERGILAAGGILESLAVSPRRRTLPLPLKVLLRNRLSSG